MKEHNRIFAILLSMALVFTYMPAMAFADTGTSNGGAALPFDGGSDTPITFYNDDGALQTAYRTSDGFAYTLVNSDGLDSVRIIGYNGGGDTINVPAKINGHVVSGFSIDPEKPLAKESYDGVRNIIFPDSMIYIRTANLDRFKALESLSGIGGNELDNAQYKTVSGVLYKKMQSGGLRVACYPHERKAKTWTIAPGVTGYIIFPYNPYLEELNITADVEVFKIYNLTALKSISVSEDNQKYASADGLLYTKDLTCLMAYPAGRTDKEFRFPDTVNYFDSDAFRVCSIDGTSDADSSIETIYLPKIIDLDLQNFSWDSFAEGNGLGNLRKIVFTDKTAPAYDKETMSWIGKELRSLKAKGVEFAAPEDGTGYDKFFADTLNVGMAPVPESPVKLTLDQKQDVEIAPGEIMTFEFTAPKFYNYAISLKSDSPFNFEYCTFDETVLQDADIQVKRQLYETSELVVDEWKTCYEYSFNLDSGKGVRNYLQIMSSDTNQNSTISVSVATSRQIGLGDIPDSCEELESGVVKTGVIPADDVNKVVTYSFTIPERDPDYEEDAYDCSFTLTRNSDHEDQLLFRQAVIDGSTSFFEAVAPEGFVPTFDFGDTLSGRIYQYLDFGKTYFIQLCPGVAGEYSVRMDLTHQGWKKSDDTGKRYKFEDVSSAGNVESIAVNDEKDVTAETGTETFTYAFKPAVSGNYTFLSEGSTDTVGRVLEGDNVIGVNDDSTNPTGKSNFGISFYGEVGKTYYLQAKLLDSEGSESSFKVVLRNYIAEHKHSEENMIYHEAVLATSEEDPGTKAYYECPVCGNFYLDANGSRETSIDDLSATYAERVTKIEFISKRPLQGNVGNDYVDDNYFYEAGNKFVLTFDNGDKREYICTKRTEDDYLGYFLDGNTEKADLCENLNIFIDSGLIGFGKNIAEFRFEFCGKILKTTAPVTGIHTHVAAAPVNEDEVAATCTAAGSYDEVVYCSECGEEMSRTSKTIAKHGHKWSETTYDWNADFTEVTATHTCANSFHTGDNPETETVGASGEVTKAATLDEEGVMTYTSEAFSKEGFEVQTTTQLIPKLTFEEAMNEAVDKTESAAGDASAADAASASSTDDADVTAAEVAAQDAANKAAVAEAAAQSMLDSANEALTALQEQGDASEEEVAAAQDEVNKATQTVAAAKKVKAAANSALAKAKKAAAKVASNKAAAASAAASSAANSAQAEAYRKQAEEAAAAAAAKAQAAAAASAEAEKAAQDLTALAENADSSIQATIEDAATAAAASANDASNAADAADKSSNDASTSESDAKKAVDDKAAAEKKAAADAAAKAAAAQKAAAEQTLIAANNGIIDPTLPKVKIKAPKKAKKSFTAQWKKLNKKQQKKVKGIEIEYSLTKDFQNPVFKATSKKKANVKVKKLKSKKTYYVRAHTYVISNGQRYVSNWSATKKVKVK